VITETIKNYMKEQQQLLSFNQEDVIYLSAQPDSQYFHWQVEVMLNNFLEVGIAPESIHTIFSYRNNKVSDGGMKLKKRFEKLGVNIYFYNFSVPDTKGYIPIVRPHVFAKHFERNQFLSTKPIFYHDCDIIFREKLDFSGMLDYDKVCYLSDTNSYINYTYIKSKSDNHIQKMCSIVGITEDTAIKFDQNSGGAQYLMKFIDYNFWRKVERDCLELYEYFSKYEIEERKTLTQEQLKSYNPIQKWCSDMWAVLWNLWFYGNETVNIKEFDFCWPGNSLERYEECKILHNAGVMGSNNENLFFKGKYQDKPPYFDDFSSININQATIKYVEAVKKVKQKYYV